jgi:hypothetical protein
MGYFRKKLERRTFSQDRYYILIKRQRSGEATFSELEELDEIVNRVPDIREKVILENFYSDDEEGKKTPPVERLNPMPRKRKNFTEVIKAFFERIWQFNSTRQEMIPMYYRRSTQPARPSIISSRYIRDC